MNPCSRKAREYGLKLFFLKTEVEKSGSQGIAQTADWRQKALET